MQEQVQGHGGFFAAGGAAREAAEALPVPLEHVLYEVFRCYTARSPEELMLMLHRRYREDATYADPTAVSRPRSDVALTFFSLQHLFSSVQVTGLSTPVLRLVPAEQRWRQQQQPQDKQELLEVVVHNQQLAAYARSNHISQQILPERTQLDTTTRLLIDPRTGLVVRHEDQWHNKPVLPLPPAWRRLNSLCMNTVYRMLGWGRVLQEAEQRALSRSGWDAE